MAGNNTPDKETLDSLYGPTFERDVLRYAIDNEALDIDLLPEWFTRDYYREVVETYSALRSRYGSSPTLSVVQSALYNDYKALSKSSPRRTPLRRAIGLCRAIARAPMANGQLRYVSDNLTKFIQRRALYVALAEGADDWAEGRYDSILARVQKAMDYSVRLSSPSLGMDYANVRDRVRAYTVQRKASRNIATGIPLLDQRIRGGVEPGNLGIVMAPSGRGKTMTLVNLGAYALVSGYNVAHITIGDVPEIVVGQRYDARLSGVPVNSIAKGASGFVRHILRAAKRAKGSLFIKEYPAHAASVADISGYLKTLQERRSIRVDMIIVDYADLVRTSSSKYDEARYRELGDVIIGLRTMAGELRAPVWTASQTGRSSYRSKHIRLSDIWESLEKVQHADIVLGMSQYEAERLRNGFRLTILKNRLGGYEGFSISMLASLDTQTIAQAQNQPS